MWNIEFKGKLEGEVDQISSDKPMPEGSVMFAVYISQYIHEYIHALTMPKSVKKQIYVMPQNQMLFV